MDCETACRTEVLELHAFFQTWFRGEPGRTREAFARFPNVLAPTFQIITPQGLAIDRQPCLDAVESGYGSDATMSIEIRNHAHRLTRGEMSLVTYEEWQTRDGTMAAWRSSAWFEQAADAPNGVRWLHVHETMLPEPTA